MYYGAGVATKLERAKRLDKRRHQGRRSLARTDGGVERGRSENMRRRETAQLRSGRGEKNGGGAVNDGRTVVYVVTESLLSSYPFGSCA